MYFTINDLLCFDDFKKIRLIAGAKGTKQGKRLWDFGL